MIGQPSQHDRPGIASVGQRDLVECRSHPAYQLLFLFRRKLLRILRRHFSERKLLLHMLPNFGLPPDMFQRSESLQVELAFLLLGRMTGHTIVAQQRPNRLLERIGGEAIGSRRR